MVATTDAMIPDMAAHRAVFAPTRTVDGARWLVRGAQRFSGVVLLMAVAGLWLYPEALYDQDILLMKLALSVVMGMIGAGLIRSGRRTRPLEMEIDLAAGEVRLMRPQPGAMPRVVHRCSFADMRHVEVVDQMARMWDAGGVLIAEVPLADPATRSALLRALSAHDRF